jgi:microcystin degradation protein MlrC
MSAPRVAVAGFQHETNTFAPFSTGWAQFQQPGAWPPFATGDKAVEQVHGLNVPLGGFVDEDAGFELVPLLYAAAEPGGYVTSEAFDRITGELCERLAAAEDIDAVYLDLHGAMVTDDYEDGEGEILARVRSVVGPDLPIAVSLDLHGNLSPEFTRLASCMTIYRTYPHIDMGATGARAARLLAQLLKRGTPFATAFRQLDYIIPITAQSTRRQPGGRLYGMLEGLAGEGVASVDFAFGFPPADIHDCGASVFACGSDQGAVDAAADAMLEALQEAEDSFISPLVSAGVAVRQAMMNNGPKPVILADPQDNPGAGAPGDATGLLAAMLAGNASGVIGMIWDATTAEQAHAAGVGAVIDAQIGGLFPEIGGPAISVRARVEQLSDGQFAFTGPMFGGMKAHLGPCARLLAQGTEVTIVIGSNRAQNADQAILRHIGANPEAYKIVAVKSAIHFLADYEPIAEEVIFAESPGANPCRIEDIPYTNLRPGVRLGPNGQEFNPNSKDQHDT